VSHRDWRARVLDMIAAIEEIQAFTAGMDFAAFKTDQRTVKATITDFAILGEAAAHVDRAILDARPEIPWQVIRAMRNTLVYAYFDVDPQILWTTIRQDLPPLLVALRALLTSK